MTDVQLQNNPQLSTKLNCKLAIAATFGQKMYGKDGLLTPNYHYPDGIDNYTIDILGDWNQVTKDADKITPIIIQHLAQGYNIIVHCNQSFHRAPLLLAYLIRRINGTEPNQFLGWLRCHRIIWSGHFATAEEVEKYEDRNHMNQKTVIARGRINTSTPPPWIKPPTSPEYPQLQPTPYPTSLPDTTTNVSFIIPTYCLSIILYGPAYTIDKDGPQPTEPPKEQASGKAGTQRKALSRPPRDSKAPWNKRNRTPITLHRASIPNNPTTKSAAIPEQFQLTYHSTMGTSRT